MNVESEKGSIHSDHNKLLLSNMLTYIHMWRWCYYPSSQLNMLNGMRWNRKVKMSVVPRIIGVCLVVIVLQASSPGLIPVTVSLFFSSLLQHQNTFLYVSVHYTKSNTCQLFLWRTYCYTMCVCSLQWPRTNVCHSCSTIHDLWPNQQGFLIQHIDRNTLQWFFFLTIKSRHIGCL